MSNFRLIDRDTGFLMPPSVDEWLPERHLARFVVEVIEGLDLRAMIAFHRQCGGLATLALAEVRHPEAYSQIETDSNARIRRMRPRRSLAPQRPAQLRRTRLRRQTAAR